MTDLRQVRSVMPALVVMVTALLGAFAQFTLPRMERLNALHAEYEGLSEYAAESEHPSGPQAGPEERDVAPFVERLEALNAAIADPSSAYDRLVDLARRSALQVESITPSRAEKESSRMELFGWTMAGTGEFAAVVDFIDALNSTAGLHRVASMRLAPAMGADSTALTLTLNVEFVRVLVPESLRPGGGDGGRISSGASEEVWP